MGLVDEAHPGNVLGLRPTVDESPQRGWPRGTDLTHASGYLFLPGWLTGAANLVFGAFEPGKVTRMMRDHRMSHMFASPSLLAALVRHPDAQCAWPHLRCILVGGAPIADATALHAHQIFGDRLFQAFRQTEAVALTAMGPTPG